MGSNGRFGGACGGGVRLAAALALAWTQAVQAAPPAGPVPGGRSIYVCVDANGRTLTADRPPPECADREIRELRGDGSVRRVIAPPPPPELRARTAIDEKQRKQLEEQQQEQVRRDQALLATYSSEADIERVERKALDRQREAVALAERRVESLRKDRRKLDEEAEFYKGRNQPEKLKAAYESNATMQAAQLKLIEDNTAELARIEASFRAERERYREAVARSGTSK